ncbi:MAG: flagellar hook capping FlgD N-terminal domain-containing protein [Myxococcota bacterium]|nr:flagellar hook capping FlgD N-terminal domain-containing protein [Myxococcota bacterium]
MVDPIQSNPAEQGYQPEPVGRSEMDKTAFLSLLVAQLEHQDPLEPMSNTEFVAQLAQFSSVEQLVAVNEGLNLLGVQQMGMANAQAASLIGNEVEIRSDKMTVYGDDSTAQAAFTLEGNASSVEVNFRDATGAVVRTMQLGPQDQGEVNVEWDLMNDNGQMVPPGTYRIDVVAEDADGVSIGWEARVRGTVDGVNYDAGYPELIIDSLRVALSDIVGIFPKDTPDGESP